MSADPSLQPSEFEPEPDAADRVVRLERLATRGVLFVALAAWIFAQTQGADLPRPWLPLAIGTSFIAVKLVVAALGFRARWRAWPVALVEASAFATALLLERLGQFRDSPVPLIAVGAVLIGANVWRRRLAAQEES